MSSDAHMFMTMDTCYSFLYLNPGNAVLKLVPQMFHIKSNQTIGLPGGRASISDDRLCPILAPEGRGERGEFEIAAKSAGHSGATERRIPESEADTWPRLVPATRLRRPLSGHGPPNLGCQGVPVPSGCAHAL